MPCSSCAITCNFQSQAGGHKARVAPCAPYAEEIQLEKEEDGEEYGKEDAISNEGARI